MLLANILSSLEWGLSFTVCLSNGKKQVSDSCLEPLTTIRIKMYNGSSYDFATLCSGVYVAPII